MMPAICCRGVSVRAVCIVWLGFALSLGLQGADDHWLLARQYRPYHQFSTLFTAQDARDRLSSEAGLKQALQWCRESGVLKVYVESFRDGYQADRAVLETARRRFAEAGLEVSGCITPTAVGKSSTGWKNTISCYTDQPTQDKIQAIFEFGAALFDEIMIDDFWFTDCSCPDCDTARQARRVTVGNRQYPVNGDTWEEYRCELMVRVSQDRLLGAARKINPRVRLIIKYPQWYDRFHDRGYEVGRETRDFDRIWVGTETRDYANQRWGGTVQYEAFFIMRWLGEIGGAKCGGGWFDWLGTTEKTYVEQARQTILGGARESMLFCYGGLQGDTGPADVAALRRHQAELFTVAREVSGREPRGIAAYKPINSHPDNEARVFDFVGMLGLPLVPCHEFPTNARAAFFSVHALKDPDLAAKLDRFVRAGKPVLLTDGLAARLAGQWQQASDRWQILRVKGDPAALLRMSRPELDKLRQPLLRPFQTRFSAPNQTGLYLFGDGSWAVENFHDEEVEISLNGRALTLPGRSWKYEWKKRAELP
jgi:hypothetical protein